MSPPPRFSPMTISQLGFDLVPPHLIAGIATEDGILEPGQIANKVTEMEKYIRIFSGF